MMPSKYLLPSARLPVLFVGHGSPMNALPGNPYHDSWRELGQHFGHRWPQPQLVLCISAHWLTHGARLTGMAHPPTVHDFGGFPKALFEQQFLAPGWPQVAAELAELLRQPSDGAPLKLDHAWGLDHGAWGVLKPMFVQADIPVIQLSMDPSRPMTEHLALGQQLQALRDQGVLIVASGNVVHNLGAMRPTPDGAQAHDWAHAFDQQVAQWLQQRDLTALTSVSDPASPVAALTRLAHPTLEHYLPLLYAAGASTDADSVEFFNVNYQASAIAMRSVVWSL